MKIILGLIVAALAADPLPTIIPYEDPTVTVPLWVSVSQAFTSAGDLKPALFPVHARRLGAGKCAVANATARPTLRFMEADECRILRGRVSHGMPDGTLAELVTHASGIYRGRVRAIHYGFFAEQPGAILEADLVSTLRPIGINTDDGLLVFYDYARFAIGGDTYCSGTVEPMIGDEFIVFVGAPPIDQARSIIFAQDRIIFQRDSELLSPRRSLDVTQIRDLRALEALAGGQ